MSDLGVVTEAGIVRFERVLPGPIERVWAYLTESDKRRTWLAAGPMEMRAGGPMQLHFRHNELTPHGETVPERFKNLESGASFKVRVTRCDPPRLLSYTWPGEPGQESEVTFELTPRGNDVLLVLTHRRLSMAAMALVGPGWHTHLAILASRLAGDTPPPFWATFTRLEGDYAQHLAGA